MFPYEVLLAPLTILFAWAGIYSPFLSLRVPYLPWIVHIPCTLASFYSVYQGYVSWDTFVHINQWGLANFHQAPAPELLTNPLRDSELVPLYSTSSTQTSITSLPSPHSNLSLSWDYQSNTNLALYNLPPHPFTLHYTPSSFFLEYPPFDSMNNTPLYSLATDFSSFPGNYYQLNPERRILIRIPHNDLDCAFLSISEHSYLRDISAPIAESTILDPSPSNPNYRQPIDPNVYRLHLLHTSGTRDVTYNPLPHPLIDNSWLQPRPINPSSLRTLNLSSQKN